MNLKRKKRKILIIDTGYVVFNAKKFINKSFPYNEETYNDFLDKLNANIRDNVLKLILKNGVSFKNVIFVRDGSRFKLWRNDIWAENYSKSGTTEPITYKKKNTSYKKYDRLIFTSAYKYINSFFVELFGCKMFKNDCLEADDIISGIVYFYSKNTNVSDIIIVGIDRDLFQLKKYDKVSFSTITGVNLDNIANIWFPRIIFNNNSFFKRIGRKKFINLNFEVFPEKIQKLILNFV